MALLIIWDLTSYVADSLNAGEALKKTIKSQGDESLVYRTWREGRIPLGERRYYSFSIVNLLPHYDYFGTLTETFGLLCSRE